MMSAVRGEGNRSTELRLVQILRARNLGGWRRQVVIEGWRPDVVFRDKRVVVFADGCFWHGCPKHYTRPMSRRSYWDQKLRSNKARDRRAADRLRRCGWSVWRIWECQIQSGSIPQRLLRKLKR